MGWNPNVQAYHDQLNAKSASIRPPIDKRVDDRRCPPSSVTPASPLRLGFPSANETASQDALAERGEKLPQSQLAPFQNPSLIELYADYWCDGWPRCGNQVWEYGQLCVQCLVDTDGER